MKRLFGILLISIQIQLLGQQDLVSLEVVPQEVVDTPPHPDVVGKYWLVSERWLWRGVARADAIVVGSMVQDHPQLTQTTIRVDQFLKTTYLDHHALTEIRLNPFDDTLLPKQEPVYVFFLREERDNTYSVVDLFAHPILPGTMDNIHAIKEEIRRQDELVQHPEKITGKHSFPLRNELTTLLSRLTESPDCEALFIENVLDWGVDCAPALIACLLNEDPHRQLPVASVTLPNPEGSFESVRLYAPTTTVELMASLLNHITWINMNEEDYDGTDKTADKIRKMWLVFLEKWSIFAEANGGVFLQPVTIVSHGTE